MVVVVVVVVVAAAFLETADGTAKVCIHARVSVRHWVQPTQHRDGLSVDGGVGSVLLLYLALLLEMEKVDLLRCPM